MNQQKGDRSLFRKRGQVFFQRGLTKTCPLFHVPFLLFAMTFVFVLSLGIGWAEDDAPPLPPGPLVLTSVRPEQLSPDYWINRLPNPDRLLKPPADLALLNEDIHREISQMTDLFTLETKRAGGPIRDQLELEYQTLRGRILCRLKP